MEIDTFPAWLAKRFGHIDDWNSLTEGDQRYWEHEARAVRRAAARNGFKIGGN